MVKHKSKLNKNTPLWVLNIKNKITRANVSKKKISLKSPKLLIQNLIKTEKLFIRFFIVAIILGVLIYSSFYYYNQYKNIEFKSFYNEEELIELNQFDDNQNILFLGIEKGEGGNNYTQFLQVLSFNKSLKTLSILSVDTFFIASYDGGLYTFRTLLNSINDTDSVKLSKYIDSTEAFLGLRIDGYIISDNLELKNIINNWNISINIDESYKSDEKFYQSGDLIKGYELSNYLFNKQYSREDNSLSYRSLNFTESFILSNKDMLNLLRAFWESETLGKVFYTNLTKDSFLTFFNNIQSAELPFYSEVISLSDGYLYDTKVEKALSANFIEVDTKVSSLIKNLEIVKESAQIEVLNGSSIPGLAGKTKRIISNAGGNIVNSGNFPESVEESVLYVNNINPESIPYTIDYIKSLFPNISISKKEYKYNTIGSIILVLGDK